MKDISISVTFTKNNNSPSLIIDYWCTQFQNHIEIEAIDFDRNWTDTKSRLELKGKSKEVHHAIGTN